MSAFRKIHSAAVLKRSADLTDREVRVVASDPSVDRAGDIMVPEGCILDGFAKNPIVLANHDSAKPIGTAEISIKESRVEALITFAPPKISSIADEFCGLMKAGVLNAVSVGFDPIEWSPLPGGGRRYDEWALLELSVVSVPAQPNAVVLERAWSPQRRVNTADWQPADLSPRERRELAGRLAVWRECRGREVSHEAWVEYCKSKFPDSSARDAISSYMDLKRGMSADQRSLERLALCEFAARHEKIKAIRAEVRAQISDAASDWDPRFDAPRYKNPAQWCADIRAADEALAQEATRKWRS